MLCVTVYLLFHIMTSWGFWFELEDIFFDFHTTQSQEINTFKICCSFACLFVPCFFIRHIFEKKIVANIILGAVRLRCCCYCYRSIVNHFESIRGKEWENILWCDDDLIANKTLNRENALICIWDLCWIHRYIIQHQTNFENIHLYFLAFRKLLSNETGLGVETHQPISTPF